MLFLVILGIEYNPPPEYVTDSIYVTPNKVSHVRNIALPKYHSFVITFPNERGFVALTQFDNITVNVGRQSIYVSESKPIESWSVYHGTPKGILSMGVCRGKIEIYANENTTIGLIAGYMKTFGGGFDVLYSGSVTTASHTVLGVNQLAGYLVTDPQTRMTVDVANATASDTWFSIFRYGGNSIQWNGDGRYSTGPYEAAMFVMRSSKVTNLNLTVSFEGGDPERNYERLWEISLDDGLTLTTSYGTEDWQFFETMTKEPKRSEYEETDATAEAGGRSKSGSVIAAVVVGILIVVGFVALVLGLSVWVVKKFGPKPEQSAVVHESLCEGEYPPPTQNYGGETHGGWQGAPPPVYPQGQWQGAPPPVYPMGQWQAPPPSQQWQSNPYADYDDRLTP